MALKIITPAEAHSIIQHPKFNLLQLKQYGFTPDFPLSETVVKRSVIEVKSGLTFGILTNIQAHSKKMQEVRAWLRLHLDPKAVVVSVSWWRSHMANLNAGGAKGSPHLIGKADDFIVPGYETEEGMRKVQACILMGIFQGKLDLCLEITNGVWTHVDSRPGKIVFENKGNGNYVVWDKAKQRQFVKGYYPNAG